MNEKLMAELAELPALFKVVGAAGLVLFIIGLLDPTRAVCVTVFNISFLIILIGVWHFRSIEEMVGDVTDAVPSSKPTNDFLTKFGKEILAWSAFISVIAGGFHLFGLPIGFRLLLLLAIPLYIRQVGLELKIYNRRLSVEDRRENLLKASRFRQKVMVYLVLLSAGACLYAVIYNYN